jgi:hypothetical protein
LGWYSTGSDAEEADMHIHKALMDINESPVYVLLNPAINHSQKDLPVSIFESGMQSSSSCYLVCDLKLYFYSIILFFVIFFSHKRMNFRLKCTFDH